MEIIGVDLATGPDKSILTFSGGHDLRCGHRVSGLNAPNRFRYYVAERLSPMSVELAVRVRPSRGFAKHSRRVKQRQQS